MRRLLLLVGALVFVDTMFYAALTPLLPHYVDDLGLGKTGAGVLTAAFGVGTLVGALPAGFLAARLGVRATILVGLALMALSSLAFGFVENAPVLDAARFVQGAGGACTWTASLAWLVAVAPAERRGELIGTALGVAIFGALLGPVLGGVASLIGTGPAFTAVAALAAVLAAAVVATPGVGRRKPTPVAALARTLVRGDLVVRMWLIALPALLFGVLSVLGPLRLDALGFGAVAIGATFLVSAGIEGTMSPIVGRVSDRRGPAWLLGPAMFASAAVTALFPWPGSGWLVAALVPAAGVAYGLFWVPAMSALSHGAEAMGLDQSYAFALMNVAWAAGQGTGSVAGGALGEAVGDAVPYSAGAVVCLATLVAFHARGVRGVGLTLQPHRPYAASDDSGPADALVVARRAGREPAPELGRETARSARDPGAEVSSSLEDAN